MVNDFKTTYTAIAAEMSKMSLAIFEGRFRNVLACLSGKNPQQHTKKVLQELVDKIRHEFNTTKRHVVLDDLIDELEIRIDRL